MFLYGGARVPPDRLVTHSDAGSQFISVRFIECLDEIGARRSIGTVADSYDHALAETPNGLDKAEFVYGNVGKTR